MVVAVYCNGGGGGGGCSGGDGADSGGRDSLVRNLGTPFCFRFCLFLFFYCQKRTHTHV